MFAIPLGLQGIGAAFIILGGFSNQATLVLSGLAIIFISDIALLLEDYLYARHRKTEKATG